MEELKISVKKINNEIKSINKKYQKYSFYSPLAELDIRSIDYSNPIFVLGILKIKKTAIITVIECMEDFI